MGEGGGGCPSRVPRDSIGGLFIVAKLRMQIAGTSLRRPRPGMRAFCFSVSFSSSVSVSVSVSVSCTCVRLHLHSPPPSLSSILSRVISWSLRRSASTPFYPPCPLSRHANRPLRPTHIQRSQALQRGKAPPSEGQPFHPSSHSTLVECLGM